MSSILGLGGFALLLFVPAGTLDYWQAWVFLGVFVGMSLLPSLYLVRVDPAAAERRMKAGPRAETRGAQQAVMTGLLLSFAAVLVVSGLDHRFGWSEVPAPIVIVGDIMVAVGLGAAMLVVFQNRYAAATITVEEGQPLVTTGLYRIVRHPMYSASIVMMIGMSLALASYWSLVPTVVGVMLLMVRIVDEEKLLIQKLTGYQEYTRKVRSRVVPGVW